MIVIPMPQVERKRQPTKREDYGRFKPHIKLGLVGSPWVDWGWVVVHYNPGRLRIGYQLSIYTAARQFVAKLNMGNQL